MTRDTNTTAGAVGLPRPGGNGALATQGGSSSHGGGTSILDLPDDIVGPILRTLCVSEDEESAGAGDADGSDGAGSVSMERAGAYSSVCRRWRAILRCSYARLALRGHELVDAGAVLHELRACRNVTCVRLVGARGSPAAEEGEGGEDWRRLLRGLADPCECPALVSLQLHFYNAREALPDLAEFLAARTTLQRLQLRVEDYQVAPPGESADKSEGEADHEDGSEDEGGSNDGADCAGHALGLGLAAWQAYHASLRTLDFGHLASLEALTLDYKDLYFPDGEDGAASWHHDLPVELHCRCHGLQRFKSHAEYVAATPQPPCRHLTPGNARRLFHDTRAEAARSSTQRPASSSGWSFSRRFGAYVLASVRLCLPSTLASLLLVAIALAWAL
eukprot:jgi/Mesen1/2036/ME000148S01137